MAVGGGHRGVVTAASYEARPFGVRSAMPSVTAKRRCPELIFVKPRFDVYREVSRQIRAIFADYTDLIEPLSLDEAYLDVTADRRGLGTARAIAEEIRRRIREETGLTASAGVSYCKFVAKLASDQNKPDGLCVITPERAQAYIAALPVSASTASARSRRASWSGSASRPGPTCRTGALPSLRRIRKLRPTGTGASAAGSTSARSRRTGRTNR